MEALELNTETSIKLKEHNVIGDLSIYRKKPEPRFVQLRLKYTMFSRGIHDIWILKSQTGKELGSYGRI